MLRVRAFGPLTVELEGVPLRSPTGATARSVLAWLLLHPGLHARAQVAGRFWPEVADGAALVHANERRWRVFRGRVERLVATRAGE